MYDRNGNWLRRRSKRVVMLSPSLPPGNTPSDAVAMAGE